MTLNKIIAHDARELQESVAGSDFNHSQLSPGKFTAELWNMQNPRTSFFVAKYDQALRVFGRTPGDGYPIVLFPGYGKGEGHINGRELSVQSIAMWGLNGEIDGLLPAGFECIILKVPEELLHKVADAMAIPDAELEPKEGPMNEGDPAALKRLTNYSRTLFKKAESLQDTGSAMLSEDAEDDLIADYLSGLVQSTDNPPVDRWRKRYQVARRTDEYLRSKLHRPVTVAEVCRELKVSRRLLHYAMVDIYQTPPMQYHLCLRLQHARGMLLTSPNRRTILEIATRSGFANAGNFSIYYKRLFGESPRATREGCVIHTLS